MRLVVLDLDGTILDPEHDRPLRPRVIEAVLAVQRAGVMVTLATGRTFDYALPLARQLKLRTPLVTSQGAVIGDPVTERVLDESNIPREWAGPVRDWAAGAEDRVVALYYRLPSGRTEIVQTRELEPPEVYDHLFGGRRRVDPTAASSAASAGLTKFIVVNEPDCQQALHRRFSPGVQVARTHDRLVEGTAAGVDKGSGLLRLLRRLGLNPESVMAVGDNENDVPMFSHVGLAVAMGNADPRVQREADWVAPGIEEDGAAVALERFILSRG